MPFESIAAVSGALIFVAMVSYRLGRKRSVHLAQRLRDLNESDAAEAVQDARQRAAEAECELKRFQEALPLQKEMKNLVGLLHSRFDKTGSITSLTKDELQFLEKAIPCSRGSW